MSCRNPPCNPAPVYIAVGGRASHQSAVADETPAAIQKEVVAVAHIFFSCNHPIA
jgi:hypothetical protein